MNYIQRFLIASLLVTSGLSYGMFTLKITRPSRVKTQPRITDYGYHTSIATQKRLDSGVPWTASYLLTTMLTPDSPHDVLESFCGKHNGSLMYGRTAETYLKTLEGMWFIGSRINRIDTIHVPQVDKEPNSWANFYSEPKQGTALDGILFRIIANQFVNKKLDKDRLYYEESQLKSATELALGLIDKFEAKSADSENLNYILDGYALFNNNYKLFKHRAIDYRTESELNSFYENFDSIIYKLTPDQACNVDQAKQMRKKMDQKIIDEIAEEKEKKEREERKRWEEESRRAKQKAEEFWKRFEKENAKGNPFENFGQQSKAKQGAVREPYIPKAKREYFILLGLDPSKSVSDKELGAAYRRKLKEFHPDTSPDVWSGKITKKDAEKTFDTLIKAHEAFQASTTFE